MRRLRLTLQTEKKLPRPASVEQMYRNLILDTLNHVYQGRRSRYSNPDIFGSSIELKRDVKSDFFVRYVRYGTEYRA